MDKGRVKCIISGLNRYELTYLEERFIEAAKDYLEEWGKLTEEQETIIESLYNEKTRWIRKGIISLANNSTQNVH